MCVVRRFLQYKYIHFIKRIKIDEDFANNFLLRRLRVLVIVIGNKVAITKTLTILKEFILRHEDSVKINDNWF